MMVFVAVTGPSGLSGRTAVTGNTLLSASNT